MILKAPRGNPGVVGGAGSRRRATRRPRRTRTTRPCAREERTRRWTPRGGLARLCRRDAARRRRSECVAVCSGAGRCARPGVRARRIPVVSARSLGVAQPAPLSACVSGNVSTTCPCLVLCASLPRSLGVSVCLSLSLPLTRRSPAFPAPSRVSVGDVRPRPRGAQLPSPRRGLRQRGPARAGTRGLLLRLQTRKTGSSTPTPTPTPRPGIATGAGDGGVRIGPVKSKKRSHHN